MIILLHGLCAYCSFSCDIRHGYTDPNFVRHATVVTTE